MPVQCWYRACCIVVGKLHWRTSEGKPNVLKTSVASCGIFLNIPAQNFDRYQLHQGHVRHRRHGRVLRRSHGHRGPLPAHQQRRLLTKRQLQLQKSMFLHNIFLVKSQYVQFYNQSFNEFPLLPRFSRNVYFVWFNFAEFILEPATSLLTL